MRLQKRGDLPEKDLLGKAGGLHEAAILESTEKLATSAELDLAASVEPELPATVELVLAAPLHGPEK